jgi:hypothetical protein
MGALCLDEEFDASQANAVEFTGKTFGPPLIGNCGELGTQS